MTVSRSQSNVSTFPANFQLTFDAARGQLPASTSRIPLDGQHVRGTRFVIPIINDMSLPQWQSQIEPARVAFVAIYNPSLGPSDETFADQLVFYYSRAAHEARAAAKKNARNDHAGGDAIRHEENEKLRHIGLAQGMVDFARSFSNGQPVDSVETEKSRVVLQELEKGWWILASIDLTRLPANVHPASETTKKGAETAAEKPSVEYSSREVSPPRLLIQQLLQAHYIFTLHHGPSLTELFVRLTRERFCSTLERYWSRFSRTWDVLLHGNPASDVFSGIKLAGGGELGIGVGEEEWGSGEREVLEDLTRRSEGLVDLVVSRFGDAATSTEDPSSHDEDTMPWMGSGNLPLASDGVVFGGINAIKRPTLRNVSLWMRQIYTYGEHAYGVRDNPVRERRKRKRRDLHPRESEPDPESENNGAPLLPKASKSVSAKDWTAKDKRIPIAHSTASKPVDTPYGIVGATEQSTEHPVIPPPIIAATEQALDKATRQAESNAAANAESTTAEDSGTTLGIPDQYMKYLTFGLSTLGKSSMQNKPQGPRRTSSSSSHTLKLQATGNGSRSEQENFGNGRDTDPTQLTHVDPMPDGESLQFRIKIQKRQENSGHFVIGFQGDLDDVSAETDADLTEESTFDGSGGSRNMLRTLHIETNPTLTTDAKQSQESLNDLQMLPANPAIQDFHRLRVLIYVHRPFMYCFLFENRTPSLSMTEFYKNLHRNLLPIHKSLLTSTGQVRTMQRIEEAQASASASDTASVLSSSKSSHTQGDANPIYDLIYDPVLLTIHTSIPNIPEPGTPAAEGLLSSKKEADKALSPPWTRVDAMNVHSQILNTLESVSRNRNEYECTSKTSRGWWIVWMKLAPSTSPAAADDAKPQTEQSQQSESAKANRRTGPRSVATLKPIESDETAQTTTTGASNGLRPVPSIASRPAPPPKDYHRIAFLVRKSNDSGNASKSSSSSRAVSSMWNSLALRPSTMTDESTGGTSAGWGPAALTGGIGVDARKYVEGLLSLNR